MTTASWIAAALALLACLLAAFVIIAGKGRALRKSQPLPPPATSAYFERNGEVIRIECPFYVGNSRENNIVFPAAKVAFEVCIFRHRDRFAFQTLKGSGEIRVNGHEMAAGYLWDGDTLLIAGQTLRFRCS